MEKSTIKKRACYGFCPSIVRWSILVFLFFPGLSSIAQDKWNFSIAGGVDVALNTDDAKLKTGVGFEFGLAYRLMPHLAIYTGWGWNQFPIDNQLDYQQEETGYMAGLQFRHPISTSRVEYMLRGGVTYKHIETENSSGKIIADSGHGLGWQAGGGIILPISKRLSLVPEIRYNSLKRDITSTNGKTSVTLNYLSTLVGVSWSF